MTTKLVSANMGIILVVERDGKQETMQFSVECPRGAKQPIDGIIEICEFLNGEFEEYEIGYIAYDWQDLGGEPPRIPIAKPKRIKAHRAISQNEFNKKIRELGYKP